LAPRYTSPDAATRPRYSLAHPCPVLSILPHTPSSKHITDDYLASTVTDSHQTRSNSILTHGHDSCAGRAQSPGGSMRDDDTSTPAVSRPGTSLLGAATAVCGAVAMGASARSLHGLAQTAHGGETLVIWVLLALAGLGALLCLYLAAVWGLAAAILLAGPASRTGTALLGALRVLAPRVARRLANGAAIATATTALTLAPGIASDHHFGTDPDAADGSSAQAV